MSVKVYPEHQKLVVPYRADIEQLVPGCSKFTARDEFFLAVPHELDAVRLLRNMGYEAPSPIQYRYDWAGGHPFDSQIVTADMLSISPRAYVLSEMGVGKTRAAAFAYDYLLGTGNAGRALIVAPLSTLVCVWENEFFENFPHIRAVVLYGDKKRRLKLLDQPADVYIVNHDGVEVIQEALMKRTDIDTIIVDELATYRNARSVRWKNLAPLVKRSRYAWGMTGAPTPNEPTDAYGQVKLLTPERVSYSFKAFRESTMRQVSQFRWVERENARQTVFDTMQPAVRFTRAQCHDLPATTFSDRMIKTDARAAAAYKKMANDLVLQLKQGKVKAANEGVQLSKLLQIAAGFVYDANGKGQYIGGVDRFKEVFTIAEECEDKMIVFAPFRFMVDALADALGKRYSVGKIHGDTPPGERAALFASFQKGDSPRILVAHPATMSHGVTLTAASTIVWAAPITSLETYQQACARITRAGQTKHTHIIHLMSTPVEQKVYKRLRHKEKTQGLLLELFSETEQQAA